MMILKLILIGFDTVCIYVSVFMVTIKANKIDPTK
jgi:hypothetical protein